MVVDLDTSANLGTWLVTGYADQAVVVGFWTLMPRGTEAGAEDLEERGRVYRALDLRSYASFDAEMRASAEGEEVVGLSVTLTQASPWNELTFVLGAEESAEVQGWAVRRGVGSVHGVDVLGLRTPLGRWRWSMRWPSAARS